MSCPSCGHDAPAGSAFCNSCGAKLVVTCASCGATPPPGSRFCNGCGGTLGSAPAIAAPERQPRDYTPKHLADKILTSRSALEGERKQVTVLFADVKSSMELARQLDPEDWHGILERFFDVLTEGVHRFEGTVNQYTGDGIMALFGAPLTHEDHAQRACYAALHLRGTLRALADELRRTRGINLSVRMGMNSGEVVVGKIGDDLRMDYTAQGHVVGLAQRMESLAEAGCAYLTESTARRVHGFLELRSLGAFEIAGSDEPIEVHALEGLGRLRTRLDLSRSRGFSKFVGRAAEVERLAVALRNVTQGNGQVVCVVADAGVGKSRLCAEFIEGCQGRSVLVDETHCPAHGKTVPLLPILDLLRSFFRIEDRDSDADARRKVAGTLVLLDESFHEVLPLVFDFLGVPDPERPAPVLAPEDRHHRLLDFVRHFVQARSAREASVILVDDLHWVDPASDEFVAQLADVVRGTRTLLLVNFRPEYSADWLRRSHVDKLALSPLGEQAIAELVRDLLGSDPSVAALPARIHQRTGGNPFFTEEVIQALIESGNLAGARGAYKLVTSVDAIQIPDQVQLILAARIDRLAEREKQVLHAAAVIGRNFDAALLAAVAELPARELSAALELLDAGEMIHATSLYPVAEYTFKHPLTHEVATSSQLARPRQRRHAAVAKALEARHAGKLDEHAALLAYHCEEAGLPLEAADWHRRAAEWIGFNDVEESLRHWHRVLELIEDEPDAEVAEIGLLSAQQTLHVGGQNGISSEVAARVFERGNRWAAQSRSPDARAELLHAYGMALALTGEIAPGLEAMERALAGTIHDADFRNEVEMVSGWGQQNVGRLHQARATLEAVIAGDFRSARTVMGYPARVFAHGIYAWVLHEMGMFSAAERATATNRRLAAEIGRNDLPFIAMQESLEVAHRGELEAAARMAGEAVAMARAQHNANITSVGMLHLGEIHALRGNWPDAQSALEESLQIARESGTTLNLEARMLAPLARAHLAQGEPARALATAEEAIAVARKRGARHHEALALIAHAEVMLGTAGAARREEIESALIAAATLIEETGAALYELDLVRVRELARTELER